MAQQSLLSCFIRFCKTTNVLMIPLVGFAIYIATSSSHHILMSVGVAAGVAAYYFLESKFHVDMHVKPLSPFFKTHEHHHENPTPETGCPEPWMFVFYFFVSMTIYSLATPILSGVWCGVAVMLFLYEWCHFLCHCNYKPKTKWGWAIRTNHLKHHNYDDTDFYEMIFVNRRN